MQRLIMFLTPVGYEVKELPEGTGMFGDWAEVEEARKQGWQKVLAEYVPDTNTRIVIMAKGRRDGPLSQDIMFRVVDDTDGQRTGPLPLLRGP